MQKSLEYSFVRAYSFKCSQHKLTRFKIERLQSTKRAHQSGMCDIDRILTFIDFNLTNRNCLIYLENTHKKGSLRIIQSDWAQKENDHLSKYFIAINFLFPEQVGIALLGTCIILKCHFANPEISTMPRWLRFVVIDCMGRFLVTTQKPWKRKTERQQMLKLGNDISRDEAVKNRCRQCDRKISEPPISTLSSNGSPGGLTLRAREISFDIASSNDSSKTDSIANELRDGEDRFTKSLEEGAKAQVEHGLHEKERAEWMYIAAVLDRLFLWLFILSVVISTVVCYFKIPTNYDITGSH